MSIVHGESSRPVSTFWPGGFAQHPAWQVRSRTILAIIKRPQSASHKSRCHVERSKTSLVYSVQDRIWNVIRDSSLLSERQYEVPGSRNLTVSGVCPPPSTHSQTSRICSPIRGQE